MFIAYGEPYPSLTPIQRSPFFLVRMEPFGVDCNVRTDIFEFYYLAEL